MNLDFSATRPARQSRPAGVRRLLAALPARLIARRGDLRSQLLCALALTAVALVARLAIAPLDGGIQYVTFFPAVALAAVVGGLRPGLITATGGVILASYFFWPPYQSFTFAFQPNVTLSNAVFLTDAALVSLAIEAMHRFYRRSLDAERELKLAANVFHNSMEGVIVTDARGVIQAVNPAFSDITGYAADEVKGRKSNLLKSDHHDAAFYRSMWEALIAHGRWQGELWNRRKSGEAYLQWLTISNVTDQAGATVRYVGMFHDVTETRKQDAHMRHLAFHDALTGLPNRTLLLDRLQHALARARREKSRLALTFIDLDGFKAINDTLGHDAGDILLSEAASRITSRLREMDTVARLGGDEFVVVTEDAGTPDDVGALAREIIAELSRPMQLRGREARIGASLGIALFPENGQDGQELIRQADGAMYAAKAAGRGTYRFAELLPASRLLQRCADQAEPPTPATKAPPCRPPAWALRRG